MKKLISYFEGLLGSNKNDFSNSLMDEIITGIHKDLRYEMKGDTLRLLGDKYISFVDSEDLFKLSKIDKIKKIEFDFDPIIYFDSKQDWKGFPLIFEDDASIVKTNSNGSITNGHFEAPDNNFRLEKIKYNNCYFKEIYMAIDDHKCLANSSVNGICANFEVKKKKALIEDILKTKVAKLNDKGNIIPYVISNENPDLINELKRMNPMKTLGIPGFNFSHVVFETNGWYSPNLLFTRDMDKVKKTGLYPCELAKKNNVDLVYEMADGWHATWINIEEIGFPELRK